MESYNSKEYYMDAYVRSPLIGYGSAPYETLKASNGVLFSLNQPIAVKHFEYILVDSAQHTFSTNIDILTLKTRCILSEVKYVELNFREAGYLLTGSFNANAFLEWVDNELEDISSYVVENRIYVLESDKNGLVVGKSQFALKEFELFMGIADSQSAVNAVISTLEEVAYTEEQAFFIGNILVHAEEYDAKGIGEVHSINVSDTCTILTTADTKPVLYAIGRINHKWYPKRLELNKYHVVDVLPLRFIK